MRFPLHLTQHARKRFDQRAITPFTVELALRFGTSRAARDGALKFAFCAASIREARAEGGKELAEMVDRFRRRNFYVVTDGTSIITAAFASNPFVH